MSKTIKKVSAVSLSLTTAVWLSGAVLIMPVAASAATVEEQIASLLAQIQVLQAQLAQQQGTSASVPSITRDLTVGAKGDDVKALQKYLNSAGYKIAASGAGSPGKESTYFGSLTKAAVAAWQKAVKLSPAAGYFGAKSRAYLASVAAGTVTVTPPATTTTGTTVPSGNTLAVEVASDNPPAKTLGSGTAFNPALKVKLTAGSQDVKVTSITLQKGGFLANTNLNGVDILDSANVRHGNVITSINADNTIQILFSSNPVVVAAGKSETLLVRFNLLSGNYNGTVSFSVQSASAVATAATTTISGTFPLSGLAMNIVNGGSSMASTSLDVLTGTGSSTLNVDAASLQEITKFRVKETSSNEGVYLYSLALYNYENAADSDYKDVTIYAPDGTSLATGQPSGKTVQLTLATPFFIDKGQTKDFTVKAKLVSGTSRKVNFVIYNNYDIDLRGSSTGVSVIPGVDTNDTGFPIGNGFNIQTIGTGSITLNRAADSPSASVTPGSSNIVLGKFTAKPSGEDMELRQVSFWIATSSANTALSGTVYVKVNGAIVYSTAATNISSSTSAYTLSTYPTLTAGQDSTIQIEGSISSSATASDTYQVKSMDIKQVKRLVTNDLLDPSTAALDGNSIAVQAAKLVVTTQSTPVANSVVAGTNDYEFATIQLNAQSGGEDVKVTKLRITYNGSTTLNTDVSNFRLFKDTDTSALTTSASTASFATATGSNDTLDFSFVNPVLVTKVTPVTLHLKANILSGAATGATQTFNVASSTSAYTATGAITGNTVTPGNSGNTMTGSGQAMTVVSAGTLTMSVVSGSGASPSQDQVVNVGTAGQVYFAFKMVSQFETQKITSLKITASSTAAASISTTTLANIKLYEGSATTPFASAAQFDGCQSNGCWVTFTASDNLLSAPVPFTGVTIYAKADVGAGGSAVLGDSFKFNIPTSTDVAIKGSATASTSGTRSGTPTASGATYVVPQNVKVEALSPTTAATIGLSAGNVVGVFKISNNGTSPVYLASTTTFRFTNGGSATNSLTFALYSSAMGGTSGDSSVTYIATSTATGASSTVDFDLTYVSAANRKIDGGSWRYLTIKNAARTDAGVTSGSMPGVPVNNNTFQLSVSALGNLLYNVVESDLGYSGNPQTNNNITENISGLYVEGTPSLAAVTAKS